MKIKTSDNMLSEDILIGIGFERLPHFTIGGILVYKLGRNRHLSIGSVGTPNETLYICESDTDDNRKITDLVCLHNYDYDGYLSKSKLEMLINSIGISNI
jgi:hypothetical protein